MGSSFSSHTSSNSHESSISSLASPFAFNPPECSYTYLHNNIEIIDDGDISIAILKMMHVDEEERFTVIYSHGNSCDIGQCKYFASKMYFLGFNIICYDYCGYGLSSKLKTTENNVYQSIESVYKYLQISEDKIILYGHSIGTGPTCWLASRINCYAVILESPYISITSMLSMNLGTIYRRLIPKHDMFPNYHHISISENKFYVIHGKDDEIINVEHSRIINRLQNITYYEIEYAGHNDISTFKEWEDIMKMIMRE